MASMERNYDVDLEIGGTTSEEDRASGVSDGLVEFNSSLKGKVNGSIVGNSGNFDDKALDKVELLIDKIPEDEACRERLALLEMKLKEKKKKCKVYKPPRPPKGPALDATDMKLVRELSEIALRKRMIKERSKALKKSRAANASSSSSNSNLTAMIITVLFCLVIVFQGISSRGASNVNGKGLIEQSSVAYGEPLISVQYPNNITPEQGREPSLGAFPNLVEEVSVSGSEEEANRVGM